MAKEQCPACGDFQGDADFDETVGQFYTCLSCGHQWHYASEAGVPKPGDCWCECQGCVNTGPHCKSMAWCRVEMTQTSEG
jgi:hypothetical protein